MSKKTVIEEDTIPAFVALEALRNHFRRVNDVQSLIPDVIEEMKEPSAYRPKLIKQLEAAFRELDKYSI